MNHLIAHSKSFKFICLSVVAVVAVVVDDNFINDELCFMFHSFDDDTNKRYNQILPITICLSWQK